MEKRTKIIIGATALVLVAAVGLRVFIYTDQQKDLAKFNADVNAIIGQSPEKTATEQAPSPDPSATPAKEGATAPEATPESQVSASPSPAPATSPAVKPTPEASPKVEPTATPKPTPEKKPVSNEPQYGEVRTNPDGSQDCFMPGFGWTEYAGAGGTQEVADFELSGNQVGQ